MNLKTWIGGGILLFAIVLYLIFGLSGTGDDRLLSNQVKKGEFKVTITTTGELEAKNSEEIQGPQGLRKAGIYRVKITDLVSEGTVVEEGDYIATLDRSEATGKLKEVNSQLKKAKSKYAQSKLDTTLKLRSKRGELKDLKIAMEQKQIEVKQSKFEPPAIQRQAEIELEKAKRAYNEAKRNYKVEKQKANAEMQEVAATLQQKQQQYDDLKALLKQFEVKAPEDGMVIYYRHSSGKKKKVGSSITPWSSEVATLPDLSVMISRTYVNEVDINQLSEQQPVNVAVDAFPEKEYTGKVIEIANVGETLPKTNAKVFEVVVELNESDTLLRPSMTTSNEIITHQKKNVLHVPLESLHSNDSISFVYLKDGGNVYKQAVKTGVTNENRVIVRDGLEKGEQVLISVPENPQELETRYLKSQAN